MTGMWFCPIKLYFCIVIYLLKEETFKEAPSDLDWVSFQKGEHWKFPFTSGCWLTGLASGMIRGKTNFLFEEWPLKRPPRTFQRPCCPVQDWLDSVDGIVPKAKVILLPILWYLHRQLQTADFLCCRECKVFIWKCKIGCRAVFFARGNETVMVGWLAVAERRCW